MIKIYKNRQNRKIDKLFTIGRKIKFFIEYNFFSKKDVNF